MVIPNKELFQGVYVTMQVMELPPRHPYVLDTVHHCERSIKAFKFMNGWLSGNMECIKPEPIVIRNVENMFSTNNVLSMEVVLVLIKLCKKVHLH